MEAQWSLSLQPGLLLPQRSVPPGDAQQGCADAAVCRCQHGPQRVPHHHAQQVLAHELAESGLRRVLSLGT